MVLITRRTSIAISKQITKKYKILTALLLAIVGLITPVLMSILDPIHTIANFNLRLQPGTFLFNFLKTEFKGARIFIYPFQITNAERFMSGEDYKLKLEEVGPFVYQEYRWYDDMKMNDDGTELSMTSKFRAEFVPEESIADPKDINLTVANLPMLSATSTLSRYPGFIRFMFSTMAAQMKSKAIMNLDMHSYFWGYKNPLITLSNKLVPGIVYFDSIGLLDRLYDKEADYKIAVGTTSKDRFQIKSVKKYLHQGGTEGVPESTLTFNDTYEGLGYPPELTPEVPISWYRVPVCRSLNLEYRGSETMEYGGEGFIYTINNKTFSGEHNSATKERLPDGLMDISTCFYGLPFAASFSHFQNADPKLLERIEGLTPDSKNFPINIVIDRRIGVTYKTQVSMQLNIVVNDISYNSEAGKFSNITLPIIRLQAEQPKMTSNIQFLFYLVYKYGPRFIIVVNIVIFIVSALLIAYAAKAIYFNWLYSNQKMFFIQPKERKSLTDTPSNIPLLSEKNNNV